MLYYFLSKLGHRLLCPSSENLTSDCKDFPECWTDNWQGVKMSIDLLTAATLCSSSWVSEPLSTTMFAHISPSSSFCSLSLWFLKQNRDRKRSWHCVLLTAATLWDCSPQSEMFAHAGKHRHTKAHTRIAAAKTLSLSENYYVHYSSHMWDDIHKSSCLDEPALLISPQLLFQIKRQATNYL